MEKYKEELLERMDENFVDYQTEIDCEMESIDIFTNVFDLVFRELKSYTGSLSKARQNNIEAVDRYRKEIEDGNEESLKYFYSHFDGGLYGTRDCGHLKRLLMVMEEESRRLRNNL